LAECETERDRLHQQLVDRANAMTQSFAQTEVQNSDADDLSELQVKIKDYKIRVIQLEDSLTQALSMLESFTRDHVTRDHSD
jgi:hypothetical protein